MTREECEIKIINYFKEIAKIYEEYAGNNHYLSLSLVDGNLSVHNEDNLTISAYVSADKYNRIFESDTGNYIDNIK